MRESVDPAECEQMYMWDAGTVGLSGVRYILLWWQFLVKMQLGDTMHNLRAKSDQSKTWKENTTVVVFFLKTQNHKIFHKIQSSKVDFKPVVYSQWLMSKTPSAN